MDALLEQILRSPKLGLYLKRIEETLAEENKRREEFLNAIDENDKAEFIGGEIIFHSPAREGHNAVVSHLGALLNVHVASRGLGKVRLEKALVSLTRNDYEPDVCFFGAEKAKEFAKDTMRYPAPDFVAEVLSLSTAANDRGVKFEDYAAHGVGEYWIVDPEAEILEQYLLGEGGAYELAIKSGTGTVRSRAIEGFAIPVRALFDDAEFAATLQALPNA